MWMCRVVVQDGERERRTGGEGQIHGTTIHGLPLSTRKRTTAPPILVAYLPSFSQSSALRVCQLFQPQSFGDYKIGFY